MVNPRNAPNSNRISIPRQISDILFNFSQSLFHINISIFLCCLNLENNIIKNCSKRATSRATFIVRIDNAIELLVVKSSFAFIMPSP